MVIHAKKKVIFVHVPKTAGSSMEKFILDKDLDCMDPEELYGVDENGRALQHLMASDIKQIVPNYAQYFSFSIVRNPYERIVSEYFWCPIEDVGHKGDQTFDEFLSYAKHVVLTQNYFANAFTDHFIPQYKFVYDDQMNKIVNHVGRFENLDKTVRIVRRKMNLEKPFPKLNARRSNERVNLTRDQKNTIYDLYKKDFELFGYAT